MHIYIHFATFAELGALGIKVVTAKGKACSFQMTLNGKRGTALQQVKIGHLGLQFQGTKIN